MVAGAWIIPGKKKTDPSLKNNTFLKVKMTVQYVRNKGTSRISLLKKIAVYEVKEAASSQEIFESFKSPLERISFKSKEIDENEEFLLGITDGSFIVLYKENGKHHAYYRVQHKDEDETFDGANTLELTSKQLIKSGTKVIINCS